MKIGYMSVLVHNERTGFTHWIYSDQEESRLVMEDVNFLDGAQTSKSRHPIRSGDMITLVSRDGWTIAGISVDGEHVYLHPTARSDKLP